MPTCLSHHQQRPHLHDVGQRGVARLVQPQVGADHCRQLHCQRLQPAVNLTGDLRCGARLVQLHLVEGGQGAGRGEGGSGRQAQSRLVLCPCQRLDKSLQVGDAQASTAPLQMCTPARFHGAHASHARSTRTCTGTKAQRSHMAFSPQQLDLPLMQTLLGATSRVQPASAPAQRH